MKIQRSNIREKYNILSKETRETIIRMYSNDISKVNISRDLDVSRTTYNSVIKKYLETDYLNSAKNGGSKNTKCTNKIKDICGGLAS